MNRTRDLQERLDAATERRAKLARERDGAARIRALPDFEARMKAAGDRAEYEIGDRSWAGRILAAFLDPTADADALQREVNEP